MTRVARSRRKSRAAAIGKPRAQKRRLEEMPGVTHPANRVCRSAVHLQPISERAAMVKDPVCGMMIDERAAAGTSVYDGHTIFFCSPTCKEQFDRNPASFVALADQQLNPSPDTPSENTADEEYMRGGKGRRDEVGPTGIYPGWTPDAPTNAPVREPGDFVKHAGGPPKQIAKR